MESNDLKIFQIVAYENSISKAALKMGYVQSNVTLRIQLLEKELGTTLLLRHNKGVTLTEDGEKLLAYAEKIISLLDEAEAAFKGDKSGCTLKIGATQTISASIVPKCLSRYSEKYPDVRLALKTDTHKNLIQQVINGELDGAFTNVSTKQRGIREEFTFTEGLVIISSAHINKKEELLKKPILVNNNMDCPYRGILEKWILANKKTPNKIIEMDSLESIIRCVAADMGISLLPKSLVTGNERIKSHELSNEFNKLMIYFIISSTLNISKQTNNFIDMVGLIK
ncbi:LysR family transcriptional regulator [Clostridium sp. 19966]|uniref:LysR family transcriptional regulator n=1 Tax=Clostridium sp. 19966 TaxID=2768166 RepID=UPI0028DE50E9|nr:LysR family transcriptional regulator [Clostridium sp. 19966]MDT8715371.1 LysR family transcriptional regulator [Clostridium sp. 19966]